MYTVGKGDVKQDYAKAGLWLEKGCNGDDALACILLGVMYQFSQGGQQKALELFKKACDMKEEKGCKALC